MRISQQKELSESYRELIEFHLDHGLEGPDELSDGDREKLSILCFLTDPNDDFIFDDSDIAEKLIEGLKMFYRYQVDELLGSADKAFSKVRDLDLQLKQELLSDLYALYKENIQEDFDSISSANSLWDDGSVDRALERQEVQRLLAA